MSCEKQKRDEDNNKIKKEDDSDDEIVYLPPNKMTDNLMKTEEGKEAIGMSPPKGLSHSVAPRQRRKKTFYCNLCMITLSSEETMISHRTGVKHTKRATEITGGGDDNWIIPVPNPPSSRVKVPVRLHEKILECHDPVVGLKYVTEVLPVSDPEMEPHYECQLCDKQGEANVILMHLLGQGHRQKFVEQLHGDDGASVMDLTQSQLLKYATDYAENKHPLRIRTKRSDEDFPWPAGKAPWSAEKGGSGTPPDGAGGRRREGLGEKKVKEERKDEWRDERNYERSYERRNDRNYERREERERRDDRREETRDERREWKSSKLPSPSSVCPPVDRTEALRMVAVAEKMMLNCLDFAQSEVGTQQARLVKMVATSINLKLLETSDGGHKKRSHDISSSSGSLPAARKHPRH